MRIQYTGSRRREITSGRPITVEPGQVFEVGDTLGNSLVQQIRRFRPAPAEKNEKNDEKFHVKQKPTIKGRGE